MSQTVQKTGSNKLLLTYYYNDHGQTIHFESFSKCKGGGIFSQ